MDRRLMVGLFCIAALGCNGGGNGDQARVGLPAGDQAGGNELQLPCRARADDVADRTCAPDLQVQIIGRDRNDRDFVFAKRFYDAIRSLDPFVIFDSPLKL